MIPEDKSYKSPEYLHGYLDGLWAYAWWKNGVAYVGSTGTTHKEAEERARREFEDGSLGSYLDKGPE